MSSTAESAFNELRAEVNRLRAWLRGLSGVVILLIATLLASRHTSPLYKSPIAFRGDTVVINYLNTQRIGLFDEVDSTAWGVVTPTQLHLTRDSVSTVLAILGGTASVAVSGGATHSAILFAAEAGSPAEGASLAFFGRDRRFLWKVPPRQ